MSVIEAAQELTMAEARVYQVKSMPSCFGAACGTKLDWYRKAHCASDRTTTFSDAQENYPKPDTEPAHLQLK